MITAANILALVAIIISTQFLFLPLGFKNDAVTNLPWHWYRKPVTVEYWSRAGKGIAATNNSGDALLILRELKGIVSFSQPRMHPIRQTT